MVGATMAVIYCSHCVLIVAAGSLLATRATTRQQMVIFALSVPILHMSYQQDGSLAHMYIWRVFQH